MCVFCTYRNLVGENFPCVIPLCVLFFCFFHSLNLSIGWLCLIIIIVGDGARDGTQSLTHLSLQLSHWPTAQALFGIISHHLIVLSIDLWWHSEPFVCSWQCGPLPTVSYWMWIHAHVHGLLSDPHVKGRRSLKTVIGISHCSPKWHEILEECSFLSLSGACTIIVF